MGGHFYGQVLVLPEFWTKLDGFNHDLGGAPSTADTSGFKILVTPKDQTSYGSTNHSQEPTVTNG